MLNPLAAAPRRPSIPLYTPANWYWAVVGSAPGFVFSSARAAYVATDIAEYLAWLAAGNSPTPIGSADELRGVLTMAGFSIIAASV